GERRAHRSRHPRRAAGPGRHLRRAVQPASGGIQIMSTAVRPPCDAGVILSAPEPISVTGDVGRWVLVATILGSSMVFIDGTAVNVALPALQTDLKATVASTQRVIEAYP